ncbi:reverse transcriptase domain-containing protein [Tanacetum coccineum]
MANQIRGIFEASRPTIKKYLEKVKEVLKGFDTVTIEHVRRNQNKKADTLSKLALMTFKHLTKEVLVEVLANRSINDKEVSKVKAEKEENWMTPIYEYLLSGLLPEDSKEARKISIKALQYNLTTSSKKYTRDLASFNMEPHSMVVRIMNQAKGNLKFLAIAVEYLIKWVEAKPITTANEKQAEQFIWEHVICRFGVPKVITSKDDKQLGEEAIPPSTERFIPIRKEYISKDKRKEGKDWEVASIKEAYYQNKL